MSVSPAFAEVLRAGRGEFNRRHGLARHRYPGIDDEVFLGLLAGPVDALVGHVAAVDGGVVPRLVECAYDLTLSLLGQRWLGPGGRAPGILDGWLALAQNAPRFIAEDPQRSLAAVANAQVHWSQQGDGIAWTQTLIALAARASSLDELLRAGQVAAWRHGLAHYRDSALARARQLPRELVAIAFGLGLREWQDAYLEKLGADRWFRPDERVPGKRPRVVARIGDFVGFGGGFPTPPLASHDGDQLLLQSDAVQFMVFADAYGASLQVAGGPAPISAQRLPTGWRIAGSVLSWPGGKLDFADHGALTSAVANADTLVLTHAYSHAATLVALPPA